MTSTCCCNKGTPRGRAPQDLRRRAESRRTAVVVVPQGDVVHRRPHPRAATASTSRIMDGGVSRLRRLSAEAGSRDIALPFDGTIGGLSANPDEDGVLHVLHRLADSRGRLRR